MSNEPQTKELGPKPAELKALIMRLYEQHHISSVLAEQLISLLALADD